MDIQEFEVFRMEHPDWHEKDGGLVAYYKLSSFAAVKDVVQQILYLAEKQNHHPTVSFDYSTVEVRTITHDVGGKITDKDIILAKGTSKIVSKHLV